MKMLRVIFLFKIFAMKGKKSMISKKNNKKRRKNAKKYTINEKNYEERKKKIYIHITYRKKSEYD